MGSFITADVWAAYKHTSIVDTQQQWRARFLTSIKNGGEDGTPNSIPNINLVDDPSIQFKETICPEKCGQH